MKTNNIFSNEEANVLVSYGKSMVNAIINGVQNEDGNVRPFDIIDYYLTMHLSLEDLFNVIKSSLSVPEIRAFKKFANKNNSKEKIYDNQALNTRRIFNVRFDEQGRYIEGSGREISMDEKIYLLDFIKENNLPYIKPVFEAGLIRFKDGFMEVPTLTR